MSNPAARDIALAYERQGNEAGPIDFSDAYMGGPPNFAYEAERGVTGKMKRSDVSYNSAYEFISYPYVTPSVGYDHVSEMAPGMLLFSVRQRIEDEAGASYILALPQVNKLFRDQWDDFVTATTAVGGDITLNPYGSSDAEQFLKWMQMYGESVLWQYDSARSVTTTNPDGHLEKYEGTEIAQYYQRAMEDDYCYLTLFGLLKRLTYIGALIEPNRGTTINEMTGEDRYSDISTLSVGVGKRVPVTQLFGTNETVAVGSKLRLNISRSYCSEGRYGAFQIRPASYINTDGPVPSELKYMDESGRMCNGRSWYVGFVLEPSSKEPSTFAMQEAANLGHLTNNKRAWEMHGTLPTFHVCMALKC